MSLPRYVWGECTRTKFGDLYRFCLVRGVADKPTHRRTNIRENTGIATPARVTWIQTSLLICHWECALCVTYVGANQLILLADIFR